jgi:hypothetical protein
VNGNPTQQQQQQQQGQRRQQQDCSINNKLQQTPTKPTQAKPNQTKPKQTRSNQTRSTQTRSTKKGQECGTKNKSGKKQHAKIPVVLFGGWNFSSFERVL